MYQAVGIISKKIYAKGTKADCFRKLQKDYPYSKYDTEHYHQERKINRVYKESIVIRKV